MLGVWLTIEDGVVWAAYADKKPFRTDWSCVNPFDGAGALFLEQPVFVPGYRHNSVLITSLLSSMRADDRLYVCGTKYVPGLVLGDGPGKILEAHAAYRGPAAPSAGGLRQVFKRDFPAFFLFYWYARAVGLVRQGAESSTCEADQNMAAELLVKHPASVYLSFLGAGGTDDFMALLGFLGEPRWYRAANKPNKLRMDSAMRLSLESCINRETQPPHLRALLHIADEACSGRLEACRWLRLLFLKKDGGSLGILAVAKAILRYLDTVWVAETDRVVPVDQIFVPEIFFNDRATVELYSNFLRQIRRSA
jgi:hypothetical protein